jgi:hypothetical protein
MNRRVDFEWSGRVQSIWDVVLYRLVTVITGPIESVVTSERARFDQTIESINIDQTGIFNNSMPPAPTANWSYRALNYRIRCLLVFPSKPLKPSIYHLIGRGHVGLGLG